MYKPKSPDGADATLKSPSGERNELGKKDGTPTPMEPTSETTLRASFAPVPSPENIPIAERDTDKSSAHFVAIDTSEGTVYSTRSTATAETLGAADVKKPTALPPKKTREQLQAELSDRIARKMEEAGRGPRTGETDNDVGKTAIESTEPRGRPGTFDTVWSPPDKNLKKAPQGKKPKAQRGNTFSQRWARKMKGSGDKAKGDERAGKTASHNATSPGASGGGAPGTFDVISPALTPNQNKNKAMLKNDQQRDSLDQRITAKIEQTGRSVGPTSGSDSAIASETSKASEASSYARTARDSFDERLGRKMAQANSSGHQDDIESPGKYKNASPVLDSEKKKALPMSTHHQDNLDQRIAAKMERGGNSCGLSSVSTSAHSSAKSKASGASSYASTASRATAARDAHASRMEEKYRRASQGDYPPHYITGRENVAEEEYDEEIPPPPSSFALQEETSNAERRNTQHLASNDVVHFEERKNANVAPESEDTDRGASQESTRAPFLNVRRFRSRRVRRNRNRESRRMVDEANAEHNAPRNQLGNEINVVPRNDNLHQPTIEMNEGDIAIPEAELVQEMDNAEAEIVKDDKYGVKILGKRFHICFVAAFLVALVGAAVALAVVFSGSGGDAEFSLAPASVRSDSPSSTPSLVPSESPTKSQAPSVSPSDSPSMVPSTELFSLIRQVVLTVSEKDTFQDADSSQSKALSWLLNDVEVNQNLSSDNLRRLQDISLRTKSTVVQRYILAVLYYSMGGESWYNRHAFLDHSKPECEWTGQANNAAKQFGGVYCNYVPSSDGLVVGLNLTTNGLIGTIPSEVTKLSYLTGLHLPGNNLRGKIPDQIGGLENLEQFVLRENQLTGGLPASIGDLHNLVLLDVRNNNINGTIPHDLINLPDQILLHFSANDIVGDVSFLCGKVREMALDCTANVECSCCVSSSVNASCSAKAGCFHDQDTFELELRTDNFGHETSWVIRDYFTNITLAQSNRTYSDNAIEPVSGCIPTSRCYTFSIFDDWGDGMCCTAGEGSYTVRINGLIVASGGEFDREESKNFGSACPLKCDNTTEVIFEVKITTDQFGSETSWDLTDDENGNAVASGGDLFDRSTYVTRECLSLGSSFTFTIKDSYGDGVCCSSGDGGYEIFVDGYKIASGGKFSFLDEVKISLKFRSSFRFRGVLAKLEPLSGSKLYDQSMPHYLASLWIAIEDPAQLPLDDPLFEQRYIMALFYFATDGDNWIMCSRDDSPTCGSQKGGPWLSGGSECGWYGNQCVTLVGTDPATGEMVTAPFEAKPEWVGHISRIEHATTAGNNLAGNFPSELGHLPAMHTIIIQNNPMFGTLPESFGNWTILQILVLTNNGLGSLFPERILENNPNLGTIYIERNKFDGPIPNFASLPLLQRLRTFDNEFTGTIDPAFGDLVILEEFNIRNNKLHGSIPEEFWKPSNNPPRQLDDFDVSGNSLTGTISVKIGSMPFLKDYRVNDNQMNGTIPEELYSTPRLEELVLANNHFTGTISTSIGNLADTINEIDLSNNNFTGLIPTEELELVSRLKHLVLHGNAMTGNISQGICDKLELGSYTKLEMLTADCEEIICNCCTQCFFGAATSLPTSSPSNVPSTTETLLSVSPTNIPTQFLIPTISHAPSFDEGYMMDLLESISGVNVYDPRTPQGKAADWILLQDPLHVRDDVNHLIQRYAMATLAFSTSHLDWFSCGGISPTSWDVMVVPPVQCDATFYNPQTGQDEIYPSINWLSEAHECDWYGAVCSNDGVMRGLDMSENNLVGTIPKEIASLQFLQYFYAIANCLGFDELGAPYGLGGPIPEEIGNMQHLQALELHYNCLSGPIPEKLYDANKLQSINLGSNFLSGTLSTRVGELEGLKAYHMFDNFNIYGTIPTELGSLEYLGFIRLQSTPLTGDIPTELTNLSKLRALYLSFTALGFRFDPSMGFVPVGATIPEKIGNMTDLSDLRMDRGPLIVGTIPDSFYKLKNLEYFWCFTTFGLGGTISTEIGNLEKLRYFIIMQNQMSGTIPDEFGNAKNLEFFWVHSNNFIGTIGDWACELRDLRLISSYADCGKFNGINDPVIECSCCTDCCDRAKGICLADD